jgi:hypothetical protein
MDIENVRSLYFKGVAMVHDPLQGKDYPVPVEIWAQISEDGTLSVDDIYEADDLIYRRPFEKHEPC